MDCGTTSSVSMFEPKASLPEVFCQQSTIPTAFPTVSPREGGSFPDLQFLTFYTEAKYDNLTISDGDGTILIIKSVENAGIKAECVSKIFGRHCHSPLCNLRIYNSG